MDQLGNRRHPYGCLARNRHYLLSYIISCSRATLVSAMCLLPPSWLGPGKDEPRHSTPADTKGLQSCNFHRANRPSEKVAHRRKKQRDMASLLPDRLPKVRDERLPIHRLHYQLCSRKTRPLQATRDQGICVTF